MREIKFRAWNKKLKKMFKIGQITIEKGSWNYEPENREYIGMSLQYQPSLVLMQYTGLQDRNGKEIYEGDIIKISGHTEFKSIVKWENYCWKCGEKSLYNISTIDWANIETIGNIYENKELLEEEE